MLQFLPACMLLTRPQRLSSSKATRLSEKDGKMLPASSQPPLITVREKRGSTSVYFVTESIMPQNTEHLAQLIKIPDLLHFIPMKRARTEECFFSTGGRGNTM